LHLICVQSSVFRKARLGESMKAAISPVAFD
jgi:hypothetical protein